MQKIVGVKRAGDKNTYFFLPTEDVKTGDKVVVSFDEFQTIGTVVLEKDENETNAFELQKIKRKATEKDLANFEELHKKAKSYLPQIKKKSLELGLMMKFVSAEYSLDGSKILIVFSSEERVDFRQLLKDLASMLKVRIELKQIGQRDEVKICGGVGPCGEPCCCGRFLKDFDHVTVKMAKIQGLSLSPTKINGVCGRLMCCLGYESETYEKMLEIMPKINSEVISPHGKGIAVYNDILRERVSVKIQEGEEVTVEDFALDEIVFGDKLKEYYANPQKFNLVKKDAKPAENKKPELFDHKSDEVKHFDHKPEDNKHFDHKPDENKHFDHKPEDNKHFDHKPNENRHFDPKKQGEARKFDKPGMANKPKNFGGNNAGGRDNFNKNRGGKQPEKYGITFETAEVAQAEHEKEQKQRLQNENMPDNRSKHFNHSYNGKGKRHFENKAKKNNPGA